MKTYFQAVLFALRLSVIAAGRRLNTFSSSLEVVPDFLLEQNNGNGDAGYSIAEEPTLSQGFDGGRFYGKANLSPSMVRAIMDIISEPLAGPIDLEKETLVKTSFMNRTSGKHVDSYDNRRLVEHDERVAFVFLNTNPDAHFVHDEVTVPVVEGDLVHFNGALTHNTVINSGTVMLLGPFHSADLSRNLEKCSCDPETCEFTVCCPPSFCTSAPTSTPSTSSAPSSTPSSAPSSAPSIAPSTSSAPSSAPSIAPSTSSAPSSAPSIAPSTSSAPSNAPSNAPSTSIAPIATTSAPTSAPTSTPTSAPTKAAKTGKGTRKSTKTGKSVSPAGTGETDAGSEEETFLSAMFDGMSLPAEACMSF